MEKALQSILSWWEIAGVDTPEIKAASVKARPKAEPQRRQTTPTASLKTPSIAVLPQSAELARNAKTLGELNKVISGFDAGEISDHARQAVFARGNPDASIMIIGEAPGRDEDIAGKPFVGRSGQLLDKMFASIGLNEEALYITNIVNWCPPGNRNPSAEEVANCKPFIMRHIELISPKIIVLVGGIPFSAMTGKTGIMKNRGQWVELTIGGAAIPALPIYHPAFLLRQPALKKNAWRDLLSLRQIYAELDPS